MAAPTSSYLNNGNVIRLEETDTAGNVLYSFDAFVAAYIYGTADIKALFYLDGVIELEIVDGNGNTTAKGFIGVIINNPANLNYQMHNASRQFKSRVETVLNGTLQNEMILLNDGGLNTRGNAVRRTDVAAAIGNLLLKGDFYSAYHVTTDNYGFKWKIGSGGTYNTLSLGTYPQAQNNLGATGKVPTSNNEVIAGDVLFFKSFISNAEGTRESEEWSFLVQPKQLGNIGYSDTYASWAYTYHAQATVWIDRERIGLGTKLWSDASMSVDAAAGWYYFQAASSGGYCYYYSFNSSTSRWEITQVLDVGQGWPAGDPANNGQPANEPTSYVYTGYSFSDIESAATAAKANIGMTSKLYRDDATGKWYTGYQGLYPNFTFSGFVESAYYACSLFQDTVESPILYVDSNQQGTFITYP